jgi:hypothetical protein
MEYIMFYLIGFILVMSLAVYGAYNLITRYRLTPKT